MKRGDGAWGSKERIGYVRLQHNRPCMNEIVLGMGAKLEIGYGVGELRVRLHGVRAKSFAWRGSYMTRPMVVVVGWRVDGYAVACSHPPKNPFRATVSPSRNITDATPATSETAPS